MARKTRLPKPAQVPSSKDSKDSTPGDDSTRSSTPELQYKSTANPYDGKNVELHVARFRDNVSEIQALESHEEKRERFRQVYATTDWAVDHRHLIKEMDVSKFVIDPKAQQLIYSIQVTLVDKLYQKFGKAEDSWEGYTLMFRNWVDSKDERKPITEAFQEFCEQIYCPIFWTLLFGIQGWEEFRKHWAQFKSCTIKITEYGMCYGDNVFHMHIDGKIGVLEPKNYTQRHMSRLLFSIVTPVVKGEVPFETAFDEKYAKEYAATNYPIWQPKKGFKNNHEFHKYMQSWYPERGLENTGLPRPHYEIPEDLLYRAKSGEVLINRSHSSKEYGCQPIHSEPNPCPDRHLYVFDWNNILHESDKPGKMLPSTEIPEENIIKQMRALEDVSKDSFTERLDEVLAKAAELLDKAAQFPGGREAVEHVLESIKSGSTCFF